MCNTIMSAKPPSMAVVAFIRALCIPLTGSDRTRRARTARTSYRGGRFQVFSNYSQEPPIRSHNKLPARGRLGPLVPLEVANSGPVFLRPAKQIGFKLPATHCSGHSWASPGSDMKISLPSGGLNMTSKSTRAGEQDAGDAGQLAPSASARKADSTWPMRGSSWFRRRAH